MKKSKLYKLVKESVKETLQEQADEERNLGDRRKANRQKNKERIEGQSDNSFVINLIKNTPEKDQFKWVKLIQQLGGDTLLPKWSPGDSDELIQAWEEIMIDINDDVDLGGGNDPDALSGFLPFWNIDGSSNCDVVEINDAWICPPGQFLNQGNIVVGPVGGPYTVMFYTNSFLCAQGNPANTQANFLTWHTTAAGGAIASGVSSFASVPGTGLEGYSDLCPQCQPDTVDAATQNSTALPTPIGGNNIGLNAPSNLNFVDDKSCVFGDFCTRQYMDNDFCRPVADGGYGDICSGQSANTNIFAAIGVNNSLCTWSGCIDVPIDNLYVCSLFSGALCNQSGVLGTPQPPGTFTNSGCTAVPGCTNSDFAATINGNYDSANNVDDSSCTLTDYCNDGTSPNTICNLSNGIFCNAQGSLINTYTDNIGQTQTITWGQPNNANCAPFGCNDDGTDPNYPGRPPQAPNTGYTNGVPDPTGTEGFRPPNYTPGTTEDGSCIYDSDGDGTWDWDEQDGCTDPAALNYDPLATEDDGSCIQPVPGCIDDGDIANNPLVQAWFDTTNLNTQDYWEGNLVINNTNYTNQTSPNTAGTQVSNPANYPGVASPNFSSTANVDNGTCKYPQGCTDDTMDNYDPNAIVDDGSCSKQGCMETTANNYDSTATTDDGTNCTFTGCAEPAAAANGIFDSDGAGVQTVLSLPGSPYDGRVLSTTLGDTLDQSCQFEGCLDNTMSNYFCDVATNAGFGYLCTGVTGPGTGTPNTAVYGQNAFIDLNPTLCTANPIAGCMDSTAGTPGTIHDHPDVNGNGSYVAMNYNPAATLPDDCDYTYCNDEDAYNYHPGPWTDSSVPNNDLCEYEGCTDNTTIAGGVSEEVFPNSGVYYYNADNDGCQIPGSNTPGTGLFLTGDLQFTNYDCCAKTGCIDDGNVTDPNFWTSNNVVTNSNYASATGVPTYPGPYPNNMTAGNYDPNATIDDGSCTYIKGCTNPGAPNYDPTAHIDDGSCVEPLRCKKVKAQQCNPALTYGQKPHTIVIDCLEISNNTPAVGDQFWHPNGITNTPPYIPNQGAPCPPGWDGTHDPSYPPIGSPANDGDIQTWNCCDYQWNANAGGWVPYPPDLLQFQCPERKKHGPKRRRGVFEVTHVYDPVGITVVNRPDWNCATPPPMPIEDIEADAELEPGMSVMGEIATSKKLRKALKSLYIPKKRKK